MMDPPNVDIGDWLQTKGQHTSRVTLKFYDGPPPVGKVVHWHQRPNFYVGPVHDVAVYGHFLTVRVPHPDQPSRLVYCNIWTCEPHWNGHCKPVKFCRIVSANQMRDGIAIANQMREGSRSPRRGRCACLGYEGTRCIFPPTPGSRWCSRCGLDHCGCACAPCDPSTSGTESSASQLGVNHQPLSSQPEVTWERGDTVIPYQDEEARARVGSPSHNPDHPCWDLYRPL